MHPHTIRDATDHPIHAFVTDAGVSNKLTLKTTTNATLLCLLLSPLCCCCCCCRDSGYKSNRFYRYL